MERLNDFEKKQMKEVILEKGFTDREVSGVKKSSLKKQLMIATAVLMIGTPIFGFTFPAIAQHIPIIGGIFEREDLHGQERLTRMSDYATVIGEMQYSDGVSITLSETFFDGQHVYATFLIESEDTISEVHMFDLDLTRIRLVVNNVSFPANSFSHFYLVDDYTAYFILGLSPSAYDDIREETDEVEVFLDLVHLLDQEAHAISEGRWTFRFPAGENLFPALDIAQTVYDEEYEIRLYSGFVSIAGFRINFSHTIPDGINVDSGFDGFEIASENEHVWTELEWQIVDNLGNALQLRGGNSSEIGTGRTGVAMSFDVPHPDATQLILTPVIVRSHMVNDNEMAETIVYHIVDRAYEVLHEMTVVVDLP